MSERGACQPSSTRKVKTTTGTTNDRATSSYADEVNVFSELEMMTLSVVCPGIQVKSVDTVSHYSPYEFSWSPLSSTRRSTLSRSRKKKKKRKKIKFWFFFRIAEKKI
jgi:hypothetical protein